MGFIGRFSKGHGARQGCFSLAENNLVQDGDAHEKGAWFCRRDYCCPELVFRVSHRIGKGTKGRCATQREDHVGKPLYRDQKACDEAAKKDPLPRAAKALLERKWASAAELQKLTEKCLAIIDEAVQSLEQSGMPAPATVMNHAVAA